MLLTADMQLQLSQRLAFPRNIDVSAKLQGHVMVTLLLFMEGILWLLSSSSTPMEEKKTGEKTF